MNNLQVIGLAGTNGSGKDTVGHLLADKHNYLFISVTDLLRNEAKRRGLAPERKVLRTISAEWRRELGLGVLIDKAVAEYDTVRDQYTGVVMASLRNPGEADRVHDLDGTVVWIDADPKIRYERIQTNAVSRGRAEEDNKTYEQFLEEEAAEMHSSGDAATLDMAAVKEKSDVCIDNGHETLEELQTHLNEKLGF